MSYGYSFLPLIVFPFRIIQDHVPETKKNISLEDISKHGCYKDKIFSNIS